MNEKLTDNASMIKSYAAACADAYIAQYVTDSGVMGEPIVFFDRTTQSFGWCSSLTPLSADEVQVETVYQDGYGDPRDWKEAGEDDLRPALIEYVAGAMQNFEAWSLVLDKIDGVEESPF